MQHDQEGVEIKLSMKSQSGFSLLCNLQNTPIRVTVISLSSLVDIFSGIIMFITVYTHKMYTPGREMVELRSGAKNKNSGAFFC